MTLSGHAVYDALLNLDREQRIVSLGGGGGSAGELAICVSNHSAAAHARG